MKLPVNIPANGDWGSDRLDVGFTVKYLDHFRGEELYFLLGDSFEPLELLYNLIDVGLLHLNSS